MSKAHRTFGLHWLHWLVVVSSLGLTLVAWYVSSTQTQAKLEQRFEFQSQQLLELVSERMSRYEDALKAGVATLSLHGNNMDAVQWREFAEHLHIDQRYPGINGIGVIYHVQPDRLDAFLREQRRLRPEFTIHPAHDNGENWPITYVEPAGINSKAIGLDIAFESNRLSGAQRARDTQSTQITAPIVLVQDARETPGFLLYVPFYDTETVATADARRAHFIGHVYAPFIMYKLVEGTLSQANRELAFSIYDEDNALYDELVAENTHFDAMPLFSKTVTMDMYGRPWTFSIQTSRAFRESADTSQPGYILMGGIVIDSMLLALFVVLSRSRAKALSLAEHMTRQSKRNALYFRNVFETAPCGIVLVDHQGRIELVNAQAEALLGYEMDDLLGKPVDLLVPEDIRARHGALQQQFRAGSAARQMGAGRQIACRRQDGSTFPVEIGLASMEDGDRRKVVVTILDISRHVELTSNLERSNRDLNDFAYVASHDLKAPLRGIVQISNWIEEELADTDATEVRDMLKMLKGRAQRLSRLLDDLLAYSQAGQIEGDTESTDTARMVEKIFEMVSSDCAFKLVLDGELPVFDTHPVPLEMIFRNLIGNAIKHHHRDSGTITISSRELPGHYEFSVSDDGPGIDPQMQARAFELFTTLKPRDKVEGSGMGLSIVNKTLSSYRCSIRLESDGARGSRFSFTWPKALPVDSQLQAA